MIKKFYLLLCSLFILASCNMDLISMAPSVLPEVPKEESSDSSIGDSQIGDGSEEVKPPFEDAQVLSKSLFASKAASPTNIMISWDPVRDADYYTVERTEHKVEDVIPKDAEWIEVGSFCESNSFVDDGDGSVLDPTLFYSYRVTPHTIVGDVGKPSDIITGNVLGSPVEVSVTKGSDENNIELSWGAMPHVERYSVYKGSSIDPIATVNSTSYIYAVPDTEKGADISFSVASVGESGVSSPQSSEYIGYTKIPGAPTINSVEVEKAENAKTLRVKFDLMGAEGTEKFQIVKSFVGGSESVVFDSSWGGSVPKDNVTGIYTFSDSNVSPNIEYTYYVSAENDKGKSEAKSGSGYLLSPPQKVQLVPVNEEIRKGYTVTIEEPIGSDINSYTYVVEQYDKHGNPMEGKSVELQYSDFNTDNKSLFTQVFFENVDQNQWNEVQYASVRTKLNGKTSDAAKSNVISNLEALKDITVSNNKMPSSSESDNSDGVYPTVLTWGNDGRGIRVTKRTGSDGSTKPLNIDCVNGTFSDNDGTKPLVKYTYTYKTIDSFGRSFGEELTTKEGYGAVNFQVYSKLYESLTLKPWDVQIYVPDTYKSYWKNQSEIAKKVGYGNAGDLSTQTKALTDDGEFIYESDHYHNGQVGYMAKIQGIGGHIEFTYANFGENSNWIGNGSYSMDVDASGNGSCSSGGFTITGMYPGSISLGGISVASKNFKGIYQITQNYAIGSKTEKVAVAN